MVSARCPRHIHVQSLTNTLGLFYFFILCKHILVVISILTPEYKLCRDFTFVCPTGEQHGATKCKKTDLFASPTEILGFNDALPQFKALGTSVIGLSHSVSTRPCDLVGVIFRRFH